VLSVHWVKNGRGGGCCFRFGGGALMGGLRAFLCHPERGCSRSRGNCALSALILAMFMLLAGVLAVVPVEDAVAAESSGYGPDGYFSKLSDGARPVVDNETGTPNSPAANGDTNTRGIMFGETNASSTNDNRTLTGIYKTLAKGPVDTEVLSFQPATTGNWHKSSTTKVLDGEALLWADEVVTKNFDYSSRNTFDFSASSKSTIATKSSDVGKNNYSSFEKQQLRNDPVEGVCTGTPCRSGSESNSPASSKGSYLVFPLSSGDMNKYLNHTGNHNSGDANLACRGVVRHDVRTKRVRPEPGRLLAS
jgi:hypothetical protein